MLEIEQGTGKLKRFKRIAMRCEKTAEGYAAFVGFAYSLILVNSVHKALGQGKSDQVGSDK